MELQEIKDKLPKEIFNIYEENGISKFTPCQEKSINAGLLDRKSILVCSPTASGKTLVAELAAVKSITEGIGKAIYIVPLKALATEKTKDFKQKYETLFNVGVSIGDFDSSDAGLSKCELIICTAEKLDSLIRHHTPWLKYISTVIIDEIHLLHDPGRGPTLEILITILKDILKDVQIIGLSATIGNPKELSEWLECELVQDDWRPTKLHQGTCLDGVVEFVE